MKNDEDIDAYREIRTEIRYEYGNLNNRVTWLLAMQAFLFSAYAIALPKEPSRSPKLQDSLFHPLLPWIGVSMSIVIFLSCYAAIIRIKQYRENQDKLTKGSIADWLGCQPVSNAALFFGLVPPVLIPGVLLGAWGHLLEWPLWLYISSPVLLILLVINDYWRKYLGRRKLNESSK